MSSFLAPTTIILLFIPIWGAAIPSPVPNSNVAFKSPIISKISSFIFLISISSHSFSRIGSPTSLTFKTFPILFHLPELFIKYIVLIYILYIIYHKLFNFKTKFITKKTYWSFVYIFIYH